MTYRHLKERSHYEEMYDRHTVERCRWHEEPRPSSEVNQEAKENLSPGQIQWCFEFVTNWILFQYVGDRYVEREGTIEKWMKKDKERDALLERARVPLVRCPSCGTAMESVHAHIGYDIGNYEREWVEFFVSCKSCKETKHVREDGSEILRKPSLCIKCDHEVESDSKKKGGKRYYVDTCKHCGHIEETLSILDEEEKEPTEDDIKRFEYDKKRFCLTDQQGRRYKDWQAAMKQTDIKKEEHIANTEFYDKLAEVKKLNIAGLEKLLKPALKKEGYADFRITMSPPAQQIILNFSVRDTEEKREDHDSRKTLEKTVEKILEDKNWALTTEGVSYRLGMLDGRIRGYESEEDLQQLTKSRMKKAGKLVKISKSKSIPDIENHLIL